MNMTKVVDRITISFFFNRHSLVDFGSSQLYPSVCLSVCLSRFYGLYLGYYGLDFDQTWWECWNFGPIDCVKI